MNIQGLQKLTLLDYPEKVACTIFTGGCNFLCPFCHNGSLVLNVNNTPIYSNNDILSFLKKREGILDGICITGGEPLIQPDLEEFLKEVRQLNYLIKLDTNGSMPNKLIKLVKNNLVDYVAMDIKNSPNLYSKTVGIKDFNILPIKESVSFLLNSNIDYEFRTTVIKEFHSKESFIDISNWISGAKAYYLQKFVESDNLITKGLTEVSKEKMEEYKKIMLKKVPNTQLRGI